MTVTLQALKRRAPAPPVRLLHLGLGNFFRAHQAWYTGHAPDGDAWGYAAFEGRSSRLSADLDAQDGLYTLVVRGAVRDDTETITSVARVHRADEHDAWLSYWRDPDIVVVTLTVTEAGYRFDVAGEHAAEVVALRTDPSSSVRSAVGRLVAGLIARRDADAGPITLLPCDNLPDNGVVLRSAVLTYVDAVDPTLREWIDGHVSFGSTMVDRITPAPTDALTQEVAELTGRTDAAPVATEPYSEWVIAAEFPRGRPDWCATFVNDVRPYENRKLWLLNGAHSLLAYAGLARGHTTVAAAIADPICLRWVTKWWDEAGQHLELPAEQVADYREQLLERFSNPRIRHELAQISSDGSEKLVARILPTLRAERAAGRLPAAACYAIGAWVAFLRQAPVPVRDPQARVLAELSASGAVDECVTNLLRFLDANLANDREVAAAVTTAVHLVADVDDLDSH